MVRSATSSSSKWTKEEQDFIRSYRAYKGKKLERGEAECLIECAKAVGLLNEKNNPLQ